MNSVCVSTIASFDGAVNPFSPRFQFLLPPSFNYSSFRLLLLAPPMLLVSSLRHFFDYTCNNFSTIPARTWDVEGSEVLVVFCLRFSSLCVNFRIQFGSLAFQLTFDAMKRSKTLIISTSRTLRLVVRHPKGLLLHFLLLLFPHFCSALRFSPNIYFFFELAFFCLCLAALLLNVIFLFFCFSSLVCFFEKNKKCVNWWFCVVLREEIEGRTEKNVERNNEKD